MNEYADIMRMERARTGNYGADIDDTLPVCPICGEESNMFYKNKASGYFVGCENCVKTVYADEVGKETLEDMSKWNG